MGLRFSTEQIEKFKLIEENYDEAFLLSQKKELRQAYNFNLKGDLALRDTDDELWSWTIAICWPRSSYFYFKINDFKESINRVKILLQCIQELIGEERDYSLIYLTIQQYHNLARVYFKMLDIEQGIKYAALAINLLNNRSSSVSHEYNLDNDYIELSKSFEISFFIQIVAETLFVLYKMKNHDEKICNLRFFIESFFIPDRLSDISSDLKLNQLLTIISKTIALCEYQTSLEYINDSNFNGDLFPLIEVVNNTITKAINYE
ncbi:hypothetical protein [Sphingobacterium anhuiense]|uniref:hypothetical protein n=1 Tax=Sphingobacterium anhuiense TaxID=493780 RepID=UPI003C2E5A3A